MHVNHKRGLRRLALALLIPWAITWATVYWINADRARAATAESSHTSMCMATGCPDDKLEIVAEEMAREEGISPAQIRANEETYLRELQAKTGAAETWKNRAIWWGVGAPIGTLIASLAAVWVWRGFRLRPASA